MFVIGVIPTRGPTPPPCSIETRAPSASCAYALTVASTYGCWPGRRGSRVARGLEGATGTGGVARPATRGRRRDRARHAADAVGAGPTARPGSSDKTDPHDARAAAVVALRHPRLRSVAADDHVVIQRLLAKRQHDLTGLRTQAIGRRTRCCACSYRVGFREG